MPPSVSRDRIIATLAGALEREPFARAAWLGGSDATGRTDEYSDVDVQVIVEDDHVDETFAVVERALEGLSAIAIRHRLPEPTWHGHSQTFYQLRDASRHHFVDLVVLKRSAPDRFLEPERHGRAHALFDRDGLLEPATLDRAGHRERMATRLTALRETFPLFQTLVERALGRGHVAEAAYWYQNLTLKPAVELLRMRHAPDRFDFGFRYLDRDLPQERRALVEALACPTAADVAACRARVEALFEEELAAFDRGDWGLPVT